MEDDYPCLRTELSYISRGLRIYFTEVIPALNLRNRVAFLGVLLPVYLHFRRLISITKETETRVLEG